MTSKEHEQLYTINCLFVKVEQDFKGNIIIGVMILYEWTLCFFLMQYSNTARCLPLNKLIEKALRGFGDERNEILLLKYLVIS